MGGYIKHNYLRDVANFHKSRAWRIFNTANVIWNHTFKMSVACSDPWLQLSIPPNATLIFDVELFDMKWTTSNDNFISFKTSSCDPSLVNRGC